jgi:putative intracellular protease/amidase
MRKPYDWSGEVKRLPMPVMLVYADSDMVRLDHIAKFYQLLGGGLRDAGWMREPTDYLMPYGILRRADVADVMTLARRPGPVKLYPSLTVRPDATIAAFDAQYPQGADYIIVPAMSRDNDPDALQWINDQAQKGATIIGICVGAKVLGAAGLLEGKRATTHWFFLKELRSDVPSVIYVANRRMVVDRKIATTTGITASMPMMLTLIEAIAGRSKAEAVGGDLGLSGWDARHDSRAFALTRPFAMTVMRNVLAFWNRDQLAMELTPGIDEVSLALVADAWSRTYRSHVVTFAPSADAVETRSGIHIIPDRIAMSWPAEERVSSFPNHRPAAALIQALRAITARYGSGTANVVAMQLEYSP